jgi:hypothetical protein
VAPARCGAGAGPPAPTARGDHVPARAGRRLEPPPLQNSQEGLCPPRVTAGAEFVRRLGLPDHARPTPSTSPRTAPPEAAQLTKPLGEAVRASQRLARWPTRAVVWVVRVVDHDVGARAPGRSGWLPARPVGAGNQDVNPAQEALVERLPAARCSTDRAVTQIRQDPIRSGIRARVSNHKEVGVAQTTKKWPSRRRGYAASRYSRIRPPSRSRRRT